MRGEKYFSFIRGEEFTICIGDGSTRKYPLTYTLEETLEDWCDSLGHGFVRVIGCHLNKNIPNLGSGKFSYNQRTVKII